MQNLAREAAETVVLVIDEEGVEFLIPELLKAASDSQVVFNLDLDTGPSKK